MLKCELDTLDLYQGRLQLGSAVCVLSGLLFDRFASFRFLRQGLLQSNQFIGYKIADFH